MSATEVEAFSRSLLEKLEQVESPPPEDLADLFGLTLRGFSPRKSALLATLHSFLLQRTVAHARRHTRYYADNAGYSVPIELVPGAAPDLSCWPLLEKQTVAENLETFLADDVHLRSVSHTSGSTGDPLQIHKSFEEVQFLGEFYQRLLSPLREQLEVAPLSLTFTNPYHGVPVPVPSLAFGFASGVTDDLLIQDALKVLQAEHHVPGHDRRISILNGFPYQLLFFTSFVFEQGIDPSSLGLDTINVTGNYTSTHWHRFLEESWGCTVQDRFSLTEIIGGASKLPDSDLFWLDPYVVGEVIDVDSQDPLEEGIGSLVLTNLHPFVQMQPLIRYRPGDLVRRVASGSLGPLLFEYLGREKHSISWHPEGRREWLVFPAKLAEILSEIPDIRIDDWFCNVRVAHDTAVGTQLISALSTVEDQGRLTIQLKLELRYAPHLYAERRRELEGHIRSALLAVPGTALAERLDSGEVVLDILLLSPGALDEPIGTKI